MIQRGGWGRFVRYAASSAAATFCSAVTLAGAYQLLHLGPQLSSVAAFLAGFMINFLGNRYWAWARRQRHRLGRDVLAYAALAVGTAGLAAGTTSLADWYTNRLSVSVSQRTVLVEVAYFATYAAMFLVKFVVLDRVLFAHRAERSVERSVEA